MMFSRRRWLAVLVAIAAVGLIELLSDSVLDNVMPFPIDTLVVVAATAAATIVGAAFAFRRIDRLAATLGERNLELLASDASARALHRVSMSLSTLTDLNDILNAIVENARSLLRADVAVLVLARPDATLRLAAASGPEAALVRSGEAKATDFRRFVLPEFLMAQLAAPVQRGGRSIGTLAVGSRAGRAYAVDAVETLASLASQAAIAIENDRLAAELREVAVRDERARIAREMHDGLAQVLGYVNTKSQAVEELLAAGDTRAARTQLGELSAAARSVYVDVREAILGLTSPVVPERGLVPAIEEYARRFTDASKVATNVTAGPDVRGVVLPGEIRAQAFRIVQEALTNVRKHAAAHRARVSIALDAEELHVTVEDDGRGFGEPPNAGEGWPRYGLQAMRERAASLGGTLAIESRPTGTRVELRVPLSSSPREG